MIIDEGEFSANSGLTYDNNNAISISHSINGDLFIYFLTEGK